MNQIREEYLRTVLMEYAAGILDEAERLVVATHLALNARSQTMLREFEALGGALVEHLAPSPLSRICAETTLARIEALEKARTQLAAQKESPVRAIPEPLQRYLGYDDFEALAWLRAFQGAMRYDIPLNSCREKRARLMKFRPGSPTPRHRHRHRELTLVLRGGFADEMGDYRVGDLCIVEEEEGVHSPVASKEGCLCLMVTEAPLVFEDRLHRLWNIFLRF